MLETEHHRGRTVFQLPIKPLLQDPIPLDRVKLAELKAAPVILSGREAVVAASSPVDLLAIRGVDCAFL